MSKNWNPGQGLSLGIGRTGADFEVREGQKIKFRFGYSRKFGFGSEAYQGYSSLANPTRLKQIYGSGFKIFANSLEKDTPRATE
jgi:hypothetical protein